MLLIATFVTGLVYSAMVIAGLILVVIGARRFRAGRGGVIAVLAIVAGLGLAGYFGVTGYDWARMIGGYFRTGVVMPN